MTNKPMEQRVAEAFGSLTTNLPFERIAQAVPDTAPQPMPTARRRYAPIVAIAACVALVLALGGLWHHLSAPESPDSDSPIALPPVVADSAVIDIDVNPSVEITVDTAECISAVTAVNPDAALLLSQLDLTKQPLAEGVQTLFGAMVAQGYVTDGNNPVLVTVRSNDTTEANRLHALVNNAVDAAMAQHSLTASVVNQTVTAFDEVAEFAQKHGISNGKAAFILKLAEQDPRLEAEKLTDHAFSVLAAIAQHENIPLGELVDYDAADGLWKDIIDALSAELTEAEHRWGSMLKVSEVKALALDALPNDNIAENALVVRIDFSWEDEEPLYRIELVSLGYLYEYTIHALDGTFLNPSGSTTTTNPHGIIRSTLHGGGTAVPIDRPTQKPPKTTTAPSATTTTATSPPTTTTGTAATTRPTVAGGSLTDEQAKDHVLFRLGATEDEVQNLSVGHHSYRNELSVYLIYNKYIYCFYMDIATGDETKIVILPTDIPIQNFRLDEWDALQIALEDACITEEECDEIMIMYFQADDTPYIQLVWETDDRYCSYRIHGVTGAIAEKVVGPLSGMGS